ncbi:N-acetylmuramoyl-L-alanine amidase family protein [Phenylobacterium montanum]|uniref:N-acetylmuramoyl-L-alanine amidase n=1 Tax=Phenylobacterium montanum TaxID=2823693 RepID=A0A975G096_9CAUL|nr:N-acetylmuramoyl-L-alanine amidase [Caulobacter sp. S6]QUD88148.1 N-acetylmuramoyl-L-alanine amidase [Caulobacter sp. S6]
MRAQAKALVGSARGTGVCALALGACALLAGSSHGETASKGVLQVRLGGNQQETRIVIELDAPTKGQVIDDGAADHMVVVNLAKVGADSQPQGHGLGLIGAWSAENAAGGTRLSLQLSHPAQIKRRFLLPPSDGVTVYRYVIDLAAADAPASATAPAKLTAAVATTVQPQAEVKPAVFTQVTEARPLHLKKIVVIDAGHGGKDPGAEGADSQEKDVNLAAAKALKARLEKGGHYKVVMTRDSDVFVPLENRVQIARRADADLFISLHSDSGSNADMRGATVYTLSDKGSDRVVKNVIGRNDWFINVNLPGHDRAVNQILLDLTQRSTRNRSAAFAENLLSHVSDRVPLLEHSHRDAGFMVLLAPDVPAVLLEMGFITNPDDETRLKSQGQRQKFMNAVGDAIDDYFERQTKVASR